MFAYFLAIAGDKVAKIFFGSKLRIEMSPDGAKAPRKFAFFYYFLTPLKLIEFFNLSNLSDALTHVYIFVFGFVLSVVYASVMIPSYDESEMCNPDNKHMHNEITNNFTQGYFIVLTSIVAMYVCVLLKEVLIG